ncbi:MAG: bifunctional methionine sulfoxide reductase B/A protein [Paludibacteraceae bacterium]|nr:bifunctional methionine sulfoxide reductase B/A protein [Paludibacteraceae bacterium]MBN2787875.1 bifunctional methionine sulfoxide reductase B/A protein [Paludibacteraceae bacterium]
MDATINKTNEEWKKELTPEQYYILREKGTESPYTGKLLLIKDKGVYHCSACGNELFSSDAKFDSHCGWPSFDKEIKAGTIKTAVDNSLGMSRTEIMCARCGGHLGHVFNDGPTETGIRYCVNSISLEFVPEADTKNYTDSITLGGGCFWCIEAIYQRLEGVIAVSSGYSGGHTENPKYNEVCEGNTGHAEVVQVVFDTRKISLEEILHVFFTSHDPTTLNRQGNDVGTQYRSVIFYSNSAQQTIAEKMIAAFNNEKVFKHPIVTEIAPLKTFYKAENYHQNYYNDNSNEPYCRLIIMPKVRKFQQGFKDILK